MRLFDLVFGQPGISLEQQGADLIGPEQIHNFLVGQNRVSERNAAAQREEQKDGNGSGRWPTPVDRDSVTR